MTKYEQAVAAYNFVKEEIKYAFPHWVSPETTRQKKKGHCGIKSELLVVMLRDLGIEARYVEGRNPRLRLLIAMRLKMMNVHFWVEAKIDGKWLTLDPAPGMGIIQLWGDTKPGMHLGKPEYITKYDEIPHWYKDGYNSALFWLLRFLSNLELTILRFIWRWKRESNM